MTDSKRPTTDPSGPPTPTSPESETTAVRVPTAAIEPPAKGPEPRRSRARAFIAAGLIAVVVASTAVATLVLTSSQSTSTVLGYVPGDSVAYGELRLDLPGDQRQNVAEFLSKFPGFADQAALDTKLDEVLDRLVSEGSKGKQTFTADIKPWFDGQLAFAAGPIPDITTPSPDAVAKDARGVLLLSVKDAALAKTWFTTTLGEAGVTGTPETYNGTELTVFGSADMPGQAAFAVADDKVAIVGDVASVKAAIDTNGSSAVATSEPVKSAQAAMAGDDLGFMFVDVRSLVTAATDAAGAAASPVPEAFLALVPGWVSGRVRVEGDAIRLDAINPHEDAAPGPNENHPNGVAAFAPPTTVALVAGNDVGATVNEWIELLEQEPSLAEIYKQVEGAVGMLGGFDGLVGWMGDTGVVVNTTGDTVEGGVVSIPTDAAKARQLFTTLRSFLALGGSQAGITVTDETYNGQTITVVDLGSLRDLAGLAGALGGGAVPSPDPSSLPDDDIRLAYVVTDEVVAIGSSPDFIKHVLDAGAGASLADDSRFKGLVERAGGQHRGLTFLDVAAVRGQVEALMASSATPQERAEYEESVKPFLVPFDALISAGAVDDGLDQTHTIVTVK